MRYSLLLLALAIPAAPAFAQADTAPPRWTVGVLAIDRDAPYRGLDENPIVAPLVRYEGEKFFFRGTRGGVRLVKSDTYEFTVFGQVRLDGYDPKDSDFLTGMEKRKASVDVGVASTWTSQKVGQFELSVAGDALNRSGGIEAVAGWNGLFRAGGWSFIPGASVSWKNADLIDYYYGVRANEVRPGRAAYSGRSALTPEVSMLATHKLGERWSLFARASYAWLPTEITDSPIVDSNSTTGLFLGVGYSPK